MREPDIVLVARAQQGDRDALDELLRDCQEPLYRYLSAVLSNAHAADDVLQEAMLRIARKVASLTEPGAFRAWAFRIASREAYRHLRRHDHKRFVDVPLDTVEEIPNPPRHLDDNEELRAAVSTLSPASRAVLVLHYWQELPLEDVAAVLEVPLGTVKSRLAYGLKQLRIMLASQS